MVRIRIFIVFKKMSIIFQSADGFVLCHRKYLQNIYSSTKKETEVVKLRPHEHLFLVNTPYMTDGEALKKVKELPAANPQIIPSRKRKFEQSSLKLPSESKVKFLSLNGWVY